MDHDQDYHLSVRKRNGTYSGYFKVTVPQKSGFNVSKTERFRNLRSKKEIDRQVGLAFAEINKLWQ